MAQFFILNSKDVIVHKFDALTLLEARGILRARCLADVASYKLAAVLRFGDLVTSVPEKTVSERAEAVPDAV